MTPERILLDFAVEMGAARESLSAVKAFQRFLSQRFRPGKQTHSEGEAAQPLGGRFEGGRAFSSQGKEFSFLLAIGVPVVGELLACEGPPPTELELDCIQRVSRGFRDRLDEVATLKGLTFTDDLTGLYNQRYLEVILDRELSLAKRNDVNFSVLFLDMDHFKNVNDTHGHLIGSRLLYEVGQEIKRTLRESDVCFRYGGDEFLIILAHTNLADALVVAERIRLQVEKKRFLAREGLDIRLTASIGVASVPDHATSKLQILKAADEALYGVKKAVRNRVIAATAKFKG
jgi:diguanylate cyclase (GGDEF)-like protein